MPAELIVKILLAVITVGVSIHIYRSNHMLNQKKHEQELKNRILDSYLEYSPESIQDKGFLLLQHGFFDYSGKNVDPEALLFIFNKHNIIYSEIYNTILIKERCYATSFHHLTMLDTLAMLC